MRYSIFQYLFLGGISFGAVGVLTPLMRKVAIKIGAFDAPNLERKVQKEPVPYLGGVAISLGVVLVSYGALLVNEPSVESFKLASYVLLPAIAISTMGLIDDLKGLEPWPRLIVQTFVGVIIAFILIATDTMGVAFNNMALDAIVTVIWIVGVCNSINFFDNHDGGATGTVAVITFFMFFIAYDRQQVLVSALAIVTSGATLGFLLWNKSPAKIYMGDAGALFLGLIIAVLTIRLNPGIEPQYKSFAIPLSLMAIPILDTTVAVSTRIHRGISPFTGGRDHLSHRLMRRGLSRRHTAFTLWGLAGVFGALALALYIWPDTLGVPLLVLIAALWGSLLLFFLRIPSTD